MSKNRDFLDYLSLGNQLVQTSRLGDLRDAQAALVALEAERVKSEQRKADTQAQEDKLREFVFNADKLVQGLERLHADSKPSGTLATLYELYQHVEKVGINTTAVRSYEDKERVHAFLENVKRVIAQCEGKLDAAALRDVKTCLRYKAEQSNLKELLCYKARQQLVADREESPRTKAPEIPTKICDYCACENDQNAENCRQCGQDVFRGVGGKSAQANDDEEVEFEQLEKPSERPVLFRFVAFLLAILILPGLLIAMAAGKLPPVVESATLSFLIYAVGAAAAVFVLAKYGADKSSKESPPLTAEEDPDKRAREELALVMDRQRVRFLEKDFGKGDFAYYKDQFLNRTAFISKVMGYDDSEDKEDDFLRNSCEGENLLERTPKPNAPVLVFGNNAPPKGWFYSGANELPTLVNLELARSGLGDKLIPLPPLNAPAYRRRYIKFLIDMGYILCFKTNDRIVIFTRLKLRIAPEGMESLKRLMNMTPETVIDHNGCVEPAAKIFASSL